MPDPTDKRATRRYATPKVIYAINFTCGHWEATWRFRSTREPCPHCREMSAQVHVLEPGQPARVVRYYPRKP